MGDGNKFAEEEARLRSLSNVLNSAGYEAYLHEDFAEELFDTMRKVANGLHDGTAEDVLLECFNDETIQNYIITHFRVRNIAI